MKLTDVLYSLGWQTIRPLLAAAGLFSPKLARAVAGRKYAASAMRAWAEEARGEREDAGRGREDAPGEREGVVAAPLVWLHGASAGELAGAAPVVEQLRRLVPDLEIVVTYSSPSGEKAAARLAPAYAGFVPLDLRSHTDEAVAALRPAALLYAKLDVWPNLTASAVRAGIPVGLVNATVRPGSRRLRQPGRAVLRRAYEALDGVGAVSVRDRPRLEALGVRPGAIRVTGDASFDHALARLRATEGRRLRLPARAPGVVRLIAGSTWAEDEAFLVEAVADLPSVELVLMPHEPTPEAIERIRVRTEARMKSRLRLYSEMRKDHEDGWEAGAPSPSPTSGPRSPPASPPEAPPPEPPALPLGVAPPPLVVDAVGFLAELYAEADIAYVGGGLAGTGLHSVVEPAAAGLPVLFGSRHDRWEARELVEGGAAIEVDPPGIHAALTALLDARRRREMGTAARAYVEAHAGAGRAGAELVRDLITPSRRGE